MNSSPPKSALEQRPHSRWPARMLPVLVCTAGLSVLGLPVLCDGAPTPSKPAAKEALTEAPHRDALERNLSAAGPGAQVHESKSPALLLEGTTSEPSSATSIRVHPRAAASVPRATDGERISAALAREALLPLNSLQLQMPDGAELSLDLDSPLLRELQVRLGMVARDPASVLLIDGRKTRFDLLQARSGETTARGFVARTARGPTGTLLFSTPYANLDLSVYSGDVQVRLLWGRDLLSWDTRARVTSR